MPRLNVTVQVNGNPLRRAYVEHIAFGISAGMYMTDDDGRVRDENGDLGINAPTGNADIRIHCQNSVVRVLDGRRANIAVFQDRAIRDGSAVNLDTNAEQQAHYAVLNRCLLVYDVVFRQFRPYATRAAPEFPLGRARSGSLQATREQKKRIEVSFPSEFRPGDVAFVEPKSQSTTYPLVHLRPQNSPALFGVVGGARPTLIPAEMAHALHFSLFDEAGRDRMQNTYLGWILSDIANGGDGLHFMGKRTSPEVAFIEALDHFSHRFAEYVREAVQGGTSTLLRQQVITPQIRQDFFRRELSGSPVLGPVVATFDSRSRIVPNAAFNGGDDEGSVYGCIFIDFARRVGLLTAVNAYLRSAADGVLTFGAFRSWIRDNASAHLAQLDQARRTWDL